jgi:hypothetical protein
MINGFAWWRHCLLTLVLLSVMYFAPVWLHPAEILYADNSDILAMHYPSRVFAVESWRATGELPLWCPYACAGQPFQADTQSNLFYPANLIFLVVPTAWIGPLFGVLVWAHVLLAGCGMFAYARVRGLEPFPALVAACGFMFAGKWLLHLLQAGHIVFAPLAWLPLLLLCIERAILHRRPIYAVIGGVVAAVIFLGAHPQLTVYLGYTAAALSLRPVLIRQEGGRLLWWVLAWGTAGIVAAGLAAVQLLPALELATWTSRAHLMTADYSECYDLTIHTLRDLGHRLLSLLGTQHWGGNAWESVGALGVLWTGTAALAVLLRRRPAVWFEAAVLLVLVLFALGPATPVAAVLRQLLPGMSPFRIPARVLLLAGFPLGMLAGQLTQYVFEVPALAGRRLRLVVLSLAALAGLYVAASLRRNLPPLSCWVPLALAVPLCGGVLVWRSLRPTPGTWAAAAWLALLLTELWAIHWPQLRTRPVEEVYAANAAVRFLAEQPGGYRVLDRPLARDEPMASPLTPSLCLLHHIDSVRGVNTTDLYPYKEFLHAVEGSDGLPRLAEMPVVEALGRPRLLDLLGVRYVLRPADAPLPGEAEAGCAPVATLHDNRAYHLDLATGGGFRELPPFLVCERATALPRAFVVSRACTVPAGESPLTTLLTQDSRTVAVLDSPGGWLERVGPPASGECGGPDFQAAAVAGAGPNRVVVDVERERPGYLVLRDAWYPGWRCRLEDGRDLPVWRADGVFRAVCVPPGRHRAEFVFAPAIHDLGRGISLATLAVLSGAAVVAAGQRLLHRPRERTATITGRPSAPAPCPARRKKGGKVLELPRSRDRIVG